MPERKLPPLVETALTGAPDAPALRRLCQSLMTHYTQDDDHATSHLEIRERLLAAHRELYDQQYAGLLETPLGWIGLIWSGQGLRELLLPRAGRGEILAQLGDEQTLATPPEELAEPLRRYFAGQPLDPLPPLDLARLPPFRRRVLDMALSIPFGQTRTYAWIGQMLGTRSYQAVGQALGANPLPIVIPCHRVVASDGSLRGYAGGLELKRRLLELEGVALAGAAVSR